MRKVFVISVLLLVLTGVVVYAALRTDRLYMSHDEVVNATVGRVLEDRDHYLPQQTADLTMASAGDSSPTSAARVVDWQIQSAEVKNTRSLVSGLLDDDPVYRLKADLLVTYDDGSTAMVQWESWRYGLVLGPVVVSMGDGPPGYIVSVSPAAQEGN